MKYLLFTVLIFLISSLASCNSNYADASSNKAKPATQDAPSSSSTGDAIFSYNLNGTRISGGEADPSQTYNTVWINKNDDGEKFTFFLNDALQAGTNTYSHSLKFTVPGKTGTVTLSVNDENKSAELFVESASDNKSIFYRNEDFTVKINNISATRIAGTFSGKSKIAPGTSADISEYTITDGKFDLPVRNVGN